MKQILFALIILTFTLRLPAQSNEPVRLALIAESDDASPALDVLTAEFSSHTNLQLLERDQIAKVYNEQALSAGNQDYLKLGQILGADGLLILNVVKTPVLTNLTTRLIAVKPGVVLADVSFPMKDISQWADSLPVFLNPFLPKLSLLVKDAIPISVVNLRSAIASEEGAQTEKELKLLAIQRLSRERQLFVLERQKMQLLGDEKSLKADDSAFWNGSYLLEGVVDQNGYSKDVIKINARLTPPKGGLPVLLEVSGSRTNLPEVINQLALKVNAALKINSTVKEWNSADEAEQYFDEAKWALRWKIFPEAQAAADSAWALGKKDLDCSLVRVNSYLLETFSKTGDLEQGSIYALPNDESGLDSEIGEISASHFATVFGRRAPETKYAALKNSPDPRNIDRALHALEIYYEFSRTSPDGKAQILSRGKGWNDWRNSPWYDLGIKDLIAASKVLQQFYLAPQLQAPVADKLAGLRALARSVSNLIVQSPSVHDSYYVGDRIATLDELSHTIDNGDIASCIFNCQVIWGCFWQDSPEEGVALYRELMNSPVFCYIHSNFWCREPGFPRLVGWNDADRSRLPEVWKHYAAELIGSTNLLFRMEGQALAVVDANTDAQIEPTFRALMDDISSNRTDLVENNVELFYQNWGIGNLLAPSGISSIRNPALDALGEQCRTNYFPMLRAMDQEYWSKTYEGNTRQGNLAAFEKQKQYLRANQPFDNSDATHKFVDMFIFGFHDYSKAQALEIQPLLAAYKSNLLEQVTQLPLQKKGWARIGRVQVGDVENKVNRILNPPPPSTQNSVAVQVPHPVSPPKKPAVVRTSTLALEIVTNVLPVTKFLEIPLTGLPGDQISGLTITGHHWFERKLLFDLTYSGLVYSYDQQGNWKETRIAAFQAIAILEPTTEKWNVIPGSEIRDVFENHYYHQSVIWNGKLFHSHGGQIKEYDLPNGHWQVLPISDGGDYELFNVNGHLYGANGNVILEITDGGTSTHLLASTRRQPAVSALDTEDLGTPTLFAGPDQTLRVSTKNKIFTWTGLDWREDSATPPSSFPPEMLADGLLFRHSDQPMSLAFISTEIKTAELWLWQRTIRPDLINSPWAIPQMAKTPEVFWKLPPNLILANLTAARCQTNLYLFANRPPVRPPAVDQTKVNEIGSQNDYDATLLCFSPGLPRPQKTFLKFDAPGARPPVARTIFGSSQSSPWPPSTWMLFTTNSMYCGLEQSSVFSSPDPVGYKAGVWVMPLDQLQAGMEKQRQDQLTQMAKNIAAAKQAQQDLLAKYDHSHNGVLDLEEKEEALDDPAFIESQLDLIDANHNGWLDATELAYFDANQNKTLEPKEQAGIEIAQHLLAGRLFEKFDANGDGLLDRSEFIELVLASQDLTVSVKPGMPNIFAIADRDGQMDLARLEAFLGQQTRVGLSVRRRPEPFRPPGNFTFDPSRHNSNQPVDQRQAFKQAVESYWGKTSDSSGRPQANSIPAN